VNGMWGLEASTLVHVSSPIGRMSCCCHVTHNIPFLCAQIKELLDRPDDLPDNSLYRLSIELTQDYV
jgi:hypothetical protein